MIKILKANKTRALSFLLTGALVGLFGCSLEPIIYNPPQNLNDGLSASNHELKSSYLDNLLKELIEQEYTGIDSILISKKSTLIFESYFNGFTENDPHDLRSATKSIASLLDEQAHSLKGLQPPCARRE